jgi:putative intracellular protease/amidase
MIRRGILGSLAIGMTVAAANAAEPTRPIAVVVAENEFTEVTDFLVPYGILAASGKFEVISVAIAEGPVNLGPALKAETATTLQRIEAVLPAPPALIVVPAIHNHGDARLVAWLRRQADSGAVIASICDGAFVTASAGLLDGRAATAHFYSTEKRQQLFPAVTWVKDARYVESGAMISTAGVSASAPASIRLVELFAGREIARATAERFGIGDYSARHDSSRFSIGVGEMWTFVANKVRGLAKTDYALELRDGIDEYSLGFSLDLLLRTSRASVETFAAAPRVTTAHGLKLIPSTLHVPSGARIELPVAVAGAWAAAPAADAALVIERPAHAIDATLRHIQARYGRRTAEFVALQLEFAWP